MSTGVHGTAPRIKGYNSGGPNCGVAALRGLLENARTEDPLFREV